MAFWINRNGTWTQISEAGGTAQKIFVNYGGGSTNWKQAQRIFVNQGGTWRRIYARVPTPPNTVTMTVNGSGASDVTVSSGSFTVNATWVNADATLPVELKYVNGAVQIGAVQDLPAGTASDSEVLAITQGQTIQLATYLRARNGGPSLDASDMYSSLGASNAISVTFPAPVITLVSLVRTPGTSDISISWTVSNPPSSNYYYTVEWDNNINGTGYQPLTDGNNQDQFASLPGSTHGFVLLDTSSTTVTFYVRVKLFMNAVQVGNAVEGQNGFFTEDAT